MSADRLLRVLIDTNVMVSGLIVPRGAPYELLEAWRAGRFVLITSADLRRELHDVLSRPKFATRLNADAVQDVMALVDALAVYVIAPANSPLVPRDPNDEIVLTPALASADFLVTGDDDLLSLRESPHLGRLRIVTPREFLNGVLDNRRD